MAAYFWFDGSSHPIFFSKKQVQEIEELKQAETDEADETFYSIVEWIRVGHYPLYALQEHHADEFRTNDQLVRLCDRLVSHGHPHPFEIIKVIVPQENWLAFLKEIRGRGLKFYNDHETYRWAKEQFATKDSAAKASQSKW